MIIVLLELHHIFIGDGKEGITNMDYQKIKHIITNIDDPYIAEKDKRSAIRSICNGNIDYLTVQDLQRAISWLYTDASFTINLKNINIKSLENRLKHLLQSEFIRSFDEVSYPSGTYKRDIKEADVQGDIMKKLVEVLPDLINSIVENVPVVVEKIIEKLPDAYLDDPDN